MNRISKSYIYLLCFFVLSSCHYKREKAQPDSWFPLDFETETPIRNIYAGSYEMNLITDDEFLRIGIDGEVSERRSINLPFNFFGDRPAIGQYSFIRQVRAQVLDSVLTQKKILEVHLVKEADPGEIYNLDLDALAPGENIVFDEFSRNSGAYNTEETQYLLTTLNNTLNKYSFFLLNLNFNFAKTRILSISVDKRIDIELDADTRLLSNVKHINGFYYICSELGAWRIDPSNGTAIKVFNSWIKDAFFYNNKIYLTGFNDFDFYVSTNNGETFGPVGTASSLKFVEVENNEIFSQTQLGLPWQMSDSDLFSANPIVVNEDFIDDGALFWNIKYFYDRYYISIQKQLYYTEDLQVD